MASDYKNSLRFFGVRILQFFWMEVAGGQGIGRRSGFGLPKAEIEDAEIRAFSGIIFR
jgi:hypothetical protein